MRVPLRAVLLSFLLRNVLWVSGVAAQERPGMITGHVMDPSESVLQGARVELEPGVITAVSDGRSEFTMTSVPAGKGACATTGFARLMWRMPINPERQFTPL